MATTAAPPQTSGAPILNLPFIIGASSVGTLIEWYDFYLYGVLALFVSEHFFSPELSPNIAFILILFVLWTGISGAAVRRDRVRPSRRSDPPQVRLYADPAADGGGDLRCLATTRSASWRRSCWR